MTESLIRKTQFKAYPNIYQKIKNAYNHRPNADLNVHSVEVTVPFGKYKGKNIDEMLKDIQYVNYLLTSDWIKIKYDHIYDILCNKYIRREPFSGALTSRIDIFDAKDIAFIKRLIPKMEFSKSKFYRRCAIQKSFVGHEHSYSTFLYLLSRKIIFDRYKKSTKDLLFTDFWTEELTKSDYIPKINKLLVLVNDCYNKIRMSILHWDKLLIEIYVLSISYLLWHKDYENVMVKISYDDILDNTKLYSKMECILGEALGSTVSKINTNPTIIIDDLVCNIDIVFDDCAVKFKASKYDNITFGDYVKVLGYCTAHKELSEKQIKNIMIINLLSGTIYKMNIKKWTESKKPNYLYLYITNIIKINKF